MTLEHTVAFDAAGENVTISYGESGAGPALVFLHGIGSAARSWNDQRERFPTFRAIAWDAPGYGESTPLAAEAPTPADYAARLAGFLDALGVARCFIVGHSLGCLMGAAFAADHSERVLGLTLCSIAAGHGRRDPEERARLLQSRIDDLRDLGSAGMAAKRGPRLLGPGATQAQVAQVVETMALVQPHGFAQAARMLSQGDIVADLARLPQRMPVDILFGDADLITPPAANRAVAATIPRARAGVLPEAGHALYIDHPAEFEALLREILTRQNAGG